jgi:hypothetical protein
MSPNRLSPSQAEQAADSLLRAARHDHIARLDRWHRFTYPLYADLGMVRPAARMTVAQQAARSVQHDPAWRRIKLVTLVLLAGLLLAWLLVGALSDRVAALLLFLLIVVLQLQFLRLKRAAVTRAVAAMRAAGDDRLLR